MSFIRKDISTKAIMSNSIGVPNLQFNSSLEKDTFPFKNSLTAIPLPFGDIGGMRICYNLRWVGVWNHYLDEIRSFWEEYCISLLRCRILVPSTP
ncbi:hypothetical protein AVEN_202137-1 [Araneus ventricosus]|uniref:Uncharacterized protein n=1 Tax=Araneus ventricosus TaxID=182803 RepID=A0A4Y2E2I2_ARAVE|nr:hypothetical protein AVEN_202137-1 [Araneus ventricosus]